MDNLSNEIWKDVIGYETLYQVSNLGRVKSIGKANEHLLKGRDDTNGYLKVALYKNKICKNFKIHRLVAIAFIENNWNRADLTIIGSAGNCTKQAKFFLDHTDYKKIPNVSDKFASTFNDDITFLKYANPPYSKGTDEIIFFKKNLKNLNTELKDNFRAHFSEEYLANL